jgi:glycosyltransferase involved in cell wall biosynthesis
MKIRYTGPAYDFSGYGEACRHDIGALLSAGVNVTTEIPKYTLEDSDFGLLGEEIKKTENNELGYRIKIIHTTPNVFPQHMEEGKYHIGRVFWETDKLPLDFAHKAQMMDEIWTGSEFNKQAIINAGVTRPIYIIPEAVDDRNTPNKYEPYKVQINKDFTFYSIFEWTERKNPKALLEAYWTEFTEKDSVALVLKTYVDNFGQRMRSEIDNEIKMVKKRLKLDYYAPVYLYRNLMDSGQIYRFHKTFDCFVSSHRGEGWGIPQMQAMLMERPIISTDCGGIHEHLNEDIAMLVPHKLISLKTNSRNTQWYTTDQNWADIDKKALKEKMRWSYKNQAKARRMGKHASPFIIKNFGLKSVGKMMAERLSMIKLDE